MVAYSFQKRFAEPILAGSKLHTIRPDRKRHARRGEELQLYVGMRTRHCRLVARKTCSAALTIALDLLHGEAVVEGADYPWKTKNTARWSGDDFDIMGTLLNAPDLECLAIRDGFSCWAEMRQFWFAAHGEPGEEEIFVGKLIGWWPQ